MASRLAGGKFMAIEEAKLYAFLANSIHDLGAMMHAATIVSCDRLGSYEAPSEGPCTAEAIAAKAAVDPCVGSLNTGGARLECAFTAGQHPLQEDRIMAEEQQEKTPLEKLKNVVVQLKEIEHHARTNMERLSEIWLLLEEEFKKREPLAERANDLLKAEGAMQDLLNAAIEEFERECAELERNA